ncbi:hypothetical protein PC110_g5350 [Phytophthora cactorum]|uniref:PiggyBac transposable element-derived protein domain-containing protein n=1 Tax=Phytophthora cactorum TaxID=29920 RepID=A0A329SS57_9STRA|nr:hypothetical protein PC110_g5350 [Phytophthora cactorum]
MEGWGKRDEQALRTQVCGKNGVNVFVGSNPQTLEQIVENEKRVHTEIRAHEILQCIVLLLARMLCPHTHRLSDRWSTNSVGSVPAGTFGRFMTLDRFELIMRNLHFSDNTTPAAHTDKAWKLSLRFPKYHEESGLILMDLAIANSFHHLP